MINNVCCISHFSSSWSETYINSSRNIWTSISDLCEDDGQAILKVEGNYFRNIYCAICNNVIHNDGVCQEGVMAYPDMFGYKGLKVLIDTSLESNAEKSRSNLLLPPADGHDHNCTGGIYDHFFVCIITFIRFNICFIHYNIKTSFASGWCRIFSQFWFIVDSNNYQSNLNYIFCKYNKLQFRRHVYVIFCRIRVEIYPVDSDMCFITMNVRCSSNKSKICL